MTPGKTIVLADSGYIPYYSSYPFIDSYCLNNADMTQGDLLTMYQRLCERILQIHPDVVILTALIDEGKVTYTPADICLAQKLNQNNQYCFMESFRTEGENSFYRYEIFQGKIV